MDYTSKLDQLFQIIKSTSDIRARSELFKLYRNCKKVYVELENERIECRKRGKSTTKYLEIEQKLNESINEFERWITFASLIYT